MIKGKTSTGFEFEISDNALNDVRVLRVLREIDKGDELALVDVAPLLLGEKQSKSLDEHCTEKEGNISLKKYAEEITEILEYEEAKN